MELTKSKMQFSCLKIVVCCPQKVVCWKYFSGAFSMDHFLVFEKISIESNEN